MPRTINDTQHAKNLATISKPMTLLMHVQCHDGIQLYDCYLAKGGFTSHYDDSLAHVHFKQAIEKIPNFNRRLSVGDKVKLDWGKIKLRYRYDDTIFLFDKQGQTRKVTFFELINQFAFGGHKFTFWLGYEEYSFDDFRLLMQGRIDKNGWKSDSKNTASLGIMDKASYLNVDIETDTFKSGKAEGEVFPSCWGGGIGQDTDGIPDRIFNLQPILISEGQNGGMGGVYSIHGADEPLGKILDVRTEGVSIPYVEDLARGQIKLVYPPADGAPIRVDIGKGACYPVGHKIATLQEGLAALPAQHFGVDPSLPLPRNKTLEVVVCRLPSTAGGIFWALMVKKQGSSWAISFAAKFQLPTHEQELIKSLVNKQGIAFKTGDIVSLSLDKALEVYGSPTTPNDEDHYLAWISPDTGAWYVDADNTGEIITAPLAGTPTIGQTYTPADQPRYQGIHLCYGFQLLNAADIIEYLSLSRTTLTKDDIDFNSFYQFKQQFTQPVGTFYSKPVKVNDAIQKFLYSLSGFSQFSLLNAKLQINHFHEPKINTLPDYTLHKWMYADNSIKPLSIRPKKSQVTVLCRINHAPHDKVAGIISEADKALYNRKNARITYRNDHKITGQINGANPPEPVTDAVFIVTETGGVYQQGEIWECIDEEWIKVDVHEFSVIYVEPALNTNSLVLEAEQYYRWNGLQWQHMGSIPKHPDAPKAKERTTFLLRKTDAEAEAKRIALLNRDDVAVYQIANSYAIGFLLENGMYLAVDAPEMLGKKTIVTSLPYDLDQNKTSITVVAFAGEQE